MEAVKVPHPTEKETIMKAIAGAILILASAIYIWVPCFVPGSIGDAGVISKYTGLALFVLGLYFLFFARDKPSP